MAMFVMLTSLTDDGMKTLRENPERIKQVNDEVSEKFGVKIMSQYMVMGDFDFVNFIEAPDNDTMVKMAIELGSRGTIRTRTMPAIEVDKVIQDLKGLQAA
ncbi:MAG: GYD domain superfamily [Candidatus Aquicultor secundus]|uniref:GYD domain superfamily n=1 Tax=Candidatus Aquicultor secundus TaxID=1973895 RepID=A0A2M7T821_9ACTN|nr:GYD domain-containing protein [Candidatus Aquicultor secundus]NCO66292.1 GYD domain-containing protein [Solirubrobacter sp.]OIO87255.1 MAG: GYD domain superfamily [Candidatus Aquicultor secundus]PIU26074.1 MAG: GYD domain superfamily [Candidatus Aquicultor secundus]PIW21349.1 MAG: GYD domain superfamily [Candidatus Aquicultor secundus]PIX52666.1 MAG: GYD domain superfamily [Candidatus Aquicultor secundus]